jgi:hypothetical protein
VTDLYLVVYSKFLLILIEAHFFGDGIYICTTHSCPHKADDDNTKVMVVI